MSSKSFWIRAGIIFLVVWPMISWAQETTWKQLDFKDIQTERRVALVIGNGDYNNVTSLVNSTNDAKDIAKTLRILQFDVIERTNLMHGEMVKAIRQFGTNLGQGTVGLFYYAGHGLQLDGQNYLLPLNASVEAADEVRYESISVNRILDKMESAQNTLNIIILDACRNNPFQARGGFRDLSSGLARIKAPTGSLIVYATAPGEKAADGKGKNGLFTKHLLKNMVRPHLDIALMLRDTRKAVKEESERLGHKSVQIPWESSSLLEPFCFAGCKVAMQTSEGLELIPVKLKPTQIKQTPSSTTKTKDSNVKNTNPILKVVRVSPYTILYAEPDINRVGKIRKGTTLNVIETLKTQDKKNWSKVEFKGQQGYVKTSHLREMY